MMRNFGSWNFLTDQQDEETRSIIRTWFRRVPDDHTFVAIAAAEYPIHALAELVSSRFPDFDFAKLAKLHQLREAEIVRFNVPKIIAAVFAAGVLLFSRIPKEIIGRWFDYEQFQLFSFFGTIAVIGYLLLFFLPWWIKQERTKSAAAKVRHVLDYIAIQQAR